MFAKLSRSPRAVWLLLIGLTVVSFTLFEGHWLTSLSTLVVVVIAACKARLVVRHFMEVAHAPGNWRFAYETWVFVAAAIIVIGHYVGAARIH